jgi:hypothetical protein
MPTQSEQVISSFLTRFAYEKLSVSATWRIPPGFKVLMLGCMSFSLTLDFEETFFLFWKKSYIYFLNLNVRILVCKLRLYDYLKLD